MQIPYVHTVCQINVDVNAKVGKKGYRPYLRLFSDLSMANLTSSRSSRSQNIKEYRVERYLAYDCVRYGDNAVYKRFTWLSLNDNTCGGGAMPDLVHVHRRRLHYWIGTNVRLP